MDDGCGLVEGVRCWQWLQCLYGGGLIYVEVAVMYGKNIINVTVVLQMWQQYHINDDPQKLRDIYDECWYSKLS